MYKKSTWSFFLLFSFICVGIAQSPPTPEKVKLKNGGLEHQFELSANTHTFDLCGLEKGGQYYGYVIEEVRPSKCQYGLEIEGATHAFTSEIHFTAKKSCQALTVSRLSCATDTPDLFPQLFLYKKAEQTEEKAGELQLVHNPDVEFLIREVLLSNSCGEISNIRTNGGQIGSFTGGLGSIGMDRGIVLSNAPIGEINGGNTGTGQGGQTVGCGGNGNDPDLAVAAGQAVCDAAVIEFDFVPVDEFMSFEYVFASDEYCDYSSSQFNDSFGFFLSGPGIDGGNIFTRNAINIALIPGTDIPVSINTVHWWSPPPGPDYYISNVSPNEMGGGCSPVELLQGGCCNTETVFDGFTVPLTAFAEVTPCETYHLKMVVADGTDQVWGSAVFLNANSFSIGGGLEVELSFNATGSNYLYEGCGDQSGVIQFIRNDVVLGSGDNISMDIDLWGTATRNSDYTLTFGQSINIPPIPSPGIWFEEINVIPDTISEGVETVYLELAVPCDCETQGLEFFIYDVDSISTSNVIDVDQCFAQPVVVTPTLEGGLPEVSIGNPPDEFTYQWTGPNGFTSDELQLNHTPPDEAGVYQYFFNAYDDCGNTVNDTVNVTVVGQPRASISGEGIVCTESPQTELEVALDGPGPWNLVYAIDGVEQPMIEVTESPYMLPATAEGNYELVTVESFGCEGDVEGVATVNTPVFSLQPTPDDPACFGTSSGTIDLAVSGGTAPYEYQWSTGQTTATATNLPSGNYAVTITDANGCTDETTAALQDPTELETTASLITGTTCAAPTAGEAAVSVTGGTGVYSYAWSSGDTNPMATGLAANIYAVTVSDENGCTSVASVEVPADDDLPTVQAAADAILTCATTEIALSGVGSSSGNNFSYQWSSPDGGNIVSGGATLTPMVDAVGTYQLVVTNQDNGCTNETTVSVTNDLTPPSPDPGQAGTLTCAETSVTLDASASTGNGTISYEWFDSGNNSLGTSAVVNVNDVGTYTLVVTNDSNGCTEDATIAVSEDVTPPAVDAGTTATLTCATTTLNLNGNNSSTGNQYTYTWTAQNGSPISDNTSLSPEISMPDTYTLMVTNTDNGCTETAAVTIDEDVTPPLAEAGEDGILTCQDEQTAIDGAGSSTGGNFTYTWTNSGGVTIANSLMTNVQNPDTYTLLVTNTDNGCTATDQVLIDADEDTPVAIAGMPQTITCDEQEVTLDGSASSTGAEFIYQWLDNTGSSVGTTPAISTEIPGTYTLVVTNTDNGCETESSVNVAEDTQNPTADPGLPQTLTCVDTELVLDGSNSSGGDNLTYEWQDDTNMSVGNTSAITVSEPSVYTLIVTNTDNGCTDEQSIQIIQDVATPVADAGSPNTITCTQTEVMLDGSASTGDNLVYEWSNSTGDVLSTSSTTMVDTDDTYALLVTNTENGCTDTQEVVIDEDVDYPIVDVGNTTELTCAILEATLDASASTGGTNLSYTWTAPDGSEIATDAVTQVTEPGIYTVAVLNMDNSCEETATLEITQDIITPMVNAGDVQTLSCALESVNLDATNGTSSGDDFVYEWTSASGNVVSGANTLTPTVDQPAMYDLVVTNTENGCTEMASVEVLADENAPTAAIEPPVELNCEVENLILDGTPSSQGGGFEYTWTTNEGTILNGQNSLTPNIAAPGVYTLSVLDTNNGCETSSSVTVEQNITIPTIAIAETDTLNCTVMSLLLDGTGTSEGTEFTYQWTTTGGNIVTETDILTPEIDQPGTYELLVVNNDNKCEETASVTVIQDIEAPEATIQPPATLTCTNESFALSGIGSSEGDVFVYKWTTMDGNIVSGDDALMPMIDAPGTYELQVTNLENTCETTVTQLVLQDVEYPEIMIAEPTILTCDIQNTLLSAAGSSSGGNFMYQWTTTNGNITQGANQTNASVNEPGTYTLSILNTENECESTMDIVVQEDVEAPIADAGDDLEITCADQTAIADGINSSQGAEFTYLWSTDDGFFSGNATNTSVTVNQVGTYTLLVTDTSNGCTSEDTMEVTSDEEIPVATIAEPAILNCTIDEVDLIGSATNGSNFSYTWTGPNGFNSPDLNTVVTSPGTYTLLVTNEDNGCTITSTAMVTEDTEPPLADAGETAELNCTVTEVALSGTGSQGGNYTYQWTLPNGTGNIVSDETTLSPVVDAAGVYALLVTNTENGCTSTDEVEITLNENVPTAINADVLPPPCFGDPAAIIVSSIDNGTGPYQYSLDGVNYSPSPTFDDLEDGTSYTVFITDANGCELEDVFEVPFVPEVTVDLEPEVEIAIGETYDLNVVTNIPQEQIASITWTPSESLSCANCLNPTSTALYTTTYNVTVVNENGCTDDAQVLLRVDREIDVYIPTAFSPYNEDGINDKFTLYAQDGVIVNVKSLHIYDRWGTKIFEQRDFPANDPAYGWDGRYFDKELGTSVFVYWAEVELATGVTEIFKGDVTLME